MYMLTHVNTSIYLFIYYYNIYSTSTAQLPHSPSYLRMERCRCVLCYSRYLTTAMVRPY